MKSIVFISLFVLAIAAGAEAAEKGVTPYGDFCPRCSTYGVSHKTVMHKAAIEAMEEYFHERGFTIGNLRGMGRFIRVDIFHHSSMVDRIIFDRKTGRIRSIY